jgi:glutathione synthase/RimK-type ligase-like ATP-grasp enzyme
MSPRAGTRIALATCAEYADLDVDDRLLISPLARLGVTAEPAVWDDPALDWARFDAVILRSTWDYPERLDAFLAWVGLVPHLLNPPPMVGWNVDKHYLHELAAAGVPIVPTVIVEPGEPPGAVPLGWDQVVVKPTVSAGSRDTARFLRDDARLLVLVERIQSSGRAVMLQPYQAAVDSAGETSLIFVDGRFSHAIRKGPLLPSDGSVTAGLFAAEEITPRNPPPVELALGERVLELITRRFGAPLYARVDVLPGPLLIEVELVEPSLFLEHGPGAADRFARAIAGALS